MLKYFIFLFAFIITFSTTSQTTIAKQSFENTGDSWIPINFSTPPCTVDGDSWNFHSTLGTITPNDGFQFWGIQDLNGNCGGSGFESIGLPNMDISGFRNTMLTFDYNIFEFDNGDDMKYEVFFDNISQGEIIIVDGTSNFSTDGWQTETINIPNHVSTVKITIFVKQNGALDYAGIDNIILTGSPLTPCSDLLISEYIEGTSSTSFRNNYIELYNPSNTIIELENYDLVKFTGESLEVSITLNLVGEIPAYGTFLIEDINENMGVDANFSTNSAVMDFTGDDKIALRKSNQIIDLIGVIGDDSNFAKDVTLRRKSNIQNPNNQFNYDEWDIYGLEDLSNINHHVSNCSGSIPEIEIIANNQIIVDGSERTSALDNTYFGTLDINSDSDIIRSFYVKNYGNADLSINSLNILGPNADNFSILLNPESNLKPLDSTEITIGFHPVSLGIKTAIISIQNNDASENPFSFYIQGEGSGINNSPLMITQYYEGLSNNKWIEITNISETETPENFYFLALYWNDDAKSPIGINPSRKIGIPALLPGQSLTYRPTLEVLKPEYALDGNEIKSSVCSFTGDDVIIISTSNDATCWENRLDIIGNSSDWGMDKSFVRKYGCEGVATNTGFSISDWFEYEISTIDMASQETNQRIGNHYTGITTFINSNQWDNGMPDKYRSAGIDSDYNSSQEGSLEICNLMVNSGKILNIEANNFVSISRNLTVNGILNIQHEASLFMIDDQGIIVNNGEIKIHKTTSTLKKYDYTYWSSPIKNAILKNVFNESPQNSFYQFLTQNYSDTNNDNLDDDNNSWQKTQGNMEIGRGYTAMAPNSIPFGESQSVIFNGEVNNGIYNVPVYLSNDHSNEYNDWNLIGNPYPSAIDAEVFLNNAMNKSLLNPTLYFWTHDTEVFTNGSDKTYSADDYSIYNIGTGGIAAHSNGLVPNGIIASGQGFFVEAIQSGNIEFKNVMRVRSGNDIFFKSSKNKNENEQDKIWLNLFNNKGIFSQILIGFFDGASKLYESYFDGLRMESTGYISFYSIAENQHLAIQGTQPFNDNEIIPLGFSSYIEEVVTLKIGIDHLEGNLKNENIYLYDALLNKTHDLKSGDYEFDLAGKGEFLDRFSLKFNNTILNIEKFNTVHESLIIKHIAESIMIKTSENSIISSINVFDILGRKIFQIEVSDVEGYLYDYIFEKTGCYFIHVTLKNSKVFIQKIIK